MDDFRSLIDGLQIAQELCDLHSENGALLAVQFALDYFGAEEEDVTAYITWTNEGIDPEWEVEFDDD